MSKNTVGFDPEKVARDLVQLFAFGAVAAAAQIVDSKFDLATAMEEAVATDAVYRALEASQKAAQKIIGTSPAFKHSLLVR